MNKKPSDIKCFIPLLPFRGYYIAHGLSWAPDYCISPANKKCKRLKGCIFRTLDEVCDFIRKHPEYNNTDFQVLGIGSYD